MCSVRRYFWWTLDFFQPQTWFWIIKEIPFRFITKNQCQSQGFSFVASASLQSPRWTIESRWHYPEDAQKFGNSHDEFPHGYGWTQWRKSTWLRSTWFGLTTMKSSCHNIHLFMHLMTCLHQQKMTWQMEVVEVNLFPYNGWRFCGCPFPGDWNPFWRWVASMVNCQS